MPTVTNFGDVVTQGNTTVTGNLIIQGGGTSSFSSATSAVTLAGTLAVTGITTHTGIILPSVDLASGIGTSATRFGNVYTANTNVYNTANIFTANIWSANVTNLAIFQNTVTHQQNTFLTDTRSYMSTAGIIVPATTGTAGLGGPSLLFANAFLQTANIGSSTAQLSLNVIGNVFVSNSVNVTNVQAVTMNLSYLNLISYANMASLNVFTGANVTTLTVSTFANIFSSNTVTGNVGTANIQLANIVSMNVTTFSNTTNLYASAQTNLFSANVTTANVASANIQVGNVVTLNVSSTANITSLNVGTFANIISSNLVTANIGTANVQLANIVSMNVTTFANTTNLYASAQTNLFSSNLITSNIATANIQVGNVVTLNVSSTANITSLNVGTFANIISSNLVTANIGTANVQLMNLVSVNVTTFANTTNLYASAQTNLFSSNLITSNIATANIQVGNVVTLNVSSTANITSLNVGTFANIISSNLVTSNIGTANIQVGNVVTLNVSSTANITSLNVGTFANIISANIVTAVHSNLNVFNTANIFTANLNSGNVVTTFNVATTLSASLHVGNASGLSNINASNVTMGILPFRNDGAIGLGPSAISINGSTGVNNQYLASTGTSLQWVGPPAAIFSQVPTSVNQIFYNSGNVAIGPQNWTLVGTGYNTYPGTPLDVYGGSGSFSNVSDAVYSGAIRIQNNAGSWASAGGLEFKTGTNSAGCGHRLVTIQDPIVNTTAPLIFQYRFATNAWSNAMAIQSGGGQAGYVGIGTMAPGYQLHIYQPSTSTAASLVVQFSGASQSSQLYLSNPSGITTVLYLNGPSLSSDGPANSATLRNNAGDLRLAGASTQPYIYLQTATNSVGFGTQTMVASSNVSFWCPNVSSSGFAYTVSADSKLGASLYAGDPGQGQFVITGVTSTNKRLALMYDTSNNISLIQSMTAGTGTNPLILNGAGGNVGIGTTSPNAPLNVWGSGPYSGLTANPQPGQLIINTTTGSQRLILGSWYTGGTGSICSIQASDYYSSLDHAQGLVLNPLGGNVGIGASPGCKLDVRGGALGVSSTSPYAAVNSYMQAGSLAIGDTLLNYGGGASQWNTNTAGLIMECLNNTEIAIHDAGDRVVSFMYYSGNRYTIGRDMGWGSIASTNFLGNVGIGIGSPLYNLQVGTNAGFIGSTTLHLANSYLDSAGQFGARITALDNGVNGHNLQIQTRTTASGGFTNSVTVTAAGKVGINATAPTGQLEVNTTGTIGMVGTGSTWGHRIIYGSYGVSSYQDGGSFYYLITNSGDQYGGYNSLRPFSFSLSTGYVTLGNGATINGGATVTGGATVNGSATVNGGLTSSGDLSCSATNANLGLNRGAIWFNGVNDTNHYLYNNYNNRDGAGAFDGMKWNTYNGLWIRGGASGANTGFFLNSSGNVGIGTTSPAYRHHVYNGDSSYTYYGPNTTWGASLLVGSGNPGNTASGGARLISTNGNCHLDSGTGQIMYLQYYNNQAGGTGGIQSWGPWSHNGNFSATGNISTSSDKRFKKNIKPIKDALKKVKKVSGYTFERDDMEGQFVGVIAQEMIEVLPEAVIADKQGMYSVAYGNITALLIQALKEEITKREEVERRLTRFEEFFEMAHMGL